MDRMGEFGYIPCMQMILTQLYERIRIEDVGFGHYEKWPPSYPIRPFWRLYWTSRKGAVWESDGQCYEPDHRQLILTPPNVQLSRKLLKPLEHGFIHFSLGMPLDLHRGSVVVLKAMPQMRKVWQVVTDHDAGLHGQFTMGKLINHALMSVPFEEQTSLQRDQRFATLLRFMQENTHRQVPNTELAEFVHLSEAAMIRRFTQVVGKSPQSLFVEMRLDEAAGQLRRDSTVSIEKVAENTGFFDRSHFCKRFVDRFGITPVVYRKMP